MNNFIIEIATSDFASSQSAAKGGADRIELCDNLAEGGTTQSYSTIKYCREQLDVQLFPIIRPRGGDFLYTHDEYNIMVNDVRVCKELNCDGVVIGLLNTDGTIDLERTARLVELALEQLIRVCCNRILTSGQRPTVMEGIELIEKLVKAADERIIIMPGSGVRKENIGEIASRTGAKELHSSLRTKVKSKMQFRHAAFGEESYEYYSVLEDDVRGLRESLISVATDR